MTHVARGSQAHRSRDRNRCRPHLGFRTPNDRRTSASGSHTGDLGLTQKLSRLVCKRPHVGRGPGEPLPHLPPPGIQSP